MGIPNKATSVLALSIVNDIKSFIENNTKALVADSKTKQADGSELLANAIAYGIAKALASPTFATAWSAGAYPSCGPGTAAALTPNIIEV